jgi:hypothetical protein
VSHHAHGKKFHDGRLRELGRAREVAIEEVIPSPRNLALHANAGAAGIDVVVEALRIGVCGVGVYFVNIGLGYGWNVLRVEDASDRTAIGLRCRTVVDGVRRARAEDYLPWS